MNTKNFYQPKYLQDENRWVVGFGGNQSRSDVQSIVTERNSTIVISPVNSVPAWKSMDIDSGLGIGGTGSDDYNINTETDTGRNSNTGCQWKHGIRYDEKCDNCGRYGMVCNDCGCCERCHK